jgi:SAM-dependent methyltransferase
MPDLWNSLDLVEAFHLSQAVATLHDLEIFITLKKPATADELSDKFGIDARILSGILEYVSARTDLLRRSGKKFVATRNYRGEARFLLDLYIGAYGGNAWKLAKLLHDPSIGPKAINKINHARAFEAVDGSTLGVLPTIIRQLEFNHLLDLGCGNGALLLELAKQNSHFVGWGIDFNPEMCRIAKAKIRAARLGKRLQVLGGDCRNVDSILPTKVSATVRAITACNIANEMFTDGHKYAISWLQGLSRALPGRPLLIADYYGSLGSKKRQVSRETLLHDYAQVISGQGVPPASAAEWRSIYLQAGCQLIHIIEDKATTRFIHILRV